MSEPLAPELAGYSTDDIKLLMEHMSEDERAELAKLVSEDMTAAIWRPMPGPQSKAYYSAADIIGYGGAAGGGKTDLAVGKALTQHTKVAIFRREGTQLTGVLDRLTDLLLSRDGYNGGDRIWRDAGPRKVQIEFGSVPNPGDEAKHQGRPKDLLVLDEAANFLESQVRFLMGWVRSTVPGQKCQTLMTFNPPTSAEGRWIVPFFGPWLDATHPGYPAEPGEIRYCAAVNGVDVWVPDVREFVLHPDGETRVYEFNRQDHRKEEIIKPLGRTFIPSRISDNPYLADTGYMSTLQALPEPLRSQMLNGDFSAGMEDDAYQVIPTAWVEAAMARWKPIEPKPEMDVVGVDVARGGRDNTIVFTRHGDWVAPPVVKPGRETPDGPTVAGLVISAVRNAAAINIDVIGVGASPFDFLRSANQDVNGVNVSEAATGTDKSGRLRFVNQRSQLWWDVRDALDPTGDRAVALPPDQKLKADLCAPTWRMSGERVLVEGRDELVKRLGRSPDYASALMLAMIDTPKRKAIRAGRPAARRGEYNPIDNSGLSAAVSSGYDHDPYANLAS